MKGINRGAVFVAVVLHQMLGFFGTAYSSQSRGSMARARRGGHGSPRTAAVYPRRRRLDSRVAGHGLADGPARYQNGRRRRNAGLRGMAGPGCPPSCRIMHSSV